MPLTNFQCCYLVYNNFRCKATYVMDCSSLSIFTPDKSFVQVKVVTPIKTRNTETLQVVSNCEVLSKVDRVHEYQFHTDQFKFKHMTDLVIDQNCVMEVGELIRGSKPNKQVDVSENDLLT